MTNCARDRFKSITTDNTVSCVKGLIPPEWEVKWEPRRSSAFETQIVEWRKNPTCSNRILLEVKNEWLWGRVDMGDQTGIVKPEKFDGALPDVVLKFIMPDTTPDPGIDMEAPSKYNLNGINAPMGLRGGCPLRGPVWKPTMYRGGSPLRMGEYRRAQCSSILIRPVIGSIGLFVEQELSTGLWFWRVAQSRREVFRMTGFELSEEAAKNATVWAFKNHHGEMDWTMSPRYGGLANKAANEYIANLETVDNRPIVVGLQ